jgi:hypothetical protein
MKISKIKHQKSKMKMEIRIPSLKAIPQFWFLILDL